MIKNETRHSPSMHHMSLRIRVKQEKDGERDTAAEERLYNEVLPNFCLGGQNFKDNGERFGNSS